MDINVERNIRGTYRRDIDGLRAVAVLAVIAFHLAPKRVVGGFVGVDVFFVISGFLISSIILDGLSRGTFSLADFYARRIRRIFPALLLVFVFIIVVGWLLLLPDEYGQVGKHLVGGTLNVSNFVYWQEAGYFDTASQVKPLLHLWSLGVEEQFYLLWPIGLMLLWRYVAAKVWWIAGLGTLSFMVCVFLAKVDVTAAFYHPVARFWQLMAGALVARMSFDSGVGRPVVTGMRNYPCFSPIWRSVASCVGVLLVGLSIVFIDSASSYPWPRALIPTVGAVLFIGSGPNAFPNRVVLSRNAFVGVGLISYPLYLWHWPLLSFLEIVKPPGPERVYKIAAVALAFLLAIITYVFVERPIRHAMGRVVGGLVIGSGACLAIGILLVYTNGFAEARGPWGIEHAPDRFEQKVMQTSDCVNAFGSNFHPKMLIERDFCVGSGMAAGRIVVFGDSHAARLFLGLRAVDAKGSYQNIGRGSCIPLLGFDGEWGDTGESLECAENTKALLDRVIATRADSVVIHGYFLRVIEGEFRLTRPADLEAQARSTLQYLSSAGIHVVLVLDVPVLPFEPYTCLSRPALSSLVRASCSFPRTEWLQRVSDTDAMLTRSADGNADVDIFDPATALCDAADCKAVVNGELLYTDSHHLSLAGAALVAKALLENLHARGR